MKLMVLDGNSILNRAFYGIKLLTTKAGDFTNGIYGFLTMLKKLLDETAPGGAAIAFDRKAPTFRHKAHAGYKANRKGACRRSWPSSCRYCRSCSPTWATALSPCEGWEADDILGTLAAACEREGSQCLIATGDRDSLQLVSDSTSVRLATTKFGQPQVTLYDVEKIQEEYGVTPPPDDRPEGHPGDSPTASPGWRALAPRAPGSLSEVWQPAVSLRPPGGAGHQARHEGQTGEVQGQRLLSYDLGTIRRDAPIDTDLSHYERGEGRPQKAAALMVKLELFSLLDKFGLSLNAQPQEGRPRRGAPRPERL